MILIDNKITLIKAGLIALALFIFIGPLPCFCADPRDLTELSLEELMDVEVTSVSKKPQKLSEVAAAVFVISGEDIRRSGVTSIPEALRMVPGLQVAKIDSSKWAITSRGFNGRYANKLLVLIDGRTVYSPQYAGVYWDAQNILMEDLDRIEVIRGPGAALWGANAVNGVINIITKHTEETQGGLITGGTGSQERGFAGVRYGGRSGEHMHYRVYGRVFDRDGGNDASGKDSHDDWNVKQAGFRMDLSGYGPDSMTLHGDIYSSDADEVMWRDALKLDTVDVDADIFGMNLLGRWTHTLSNTAEMALQMYYEHTRRDNNYNGLMIENTIDLDFQHRFIWKENHGFVCGLGYRMVRDDLDETFYVSFEPENKNTDLFSGFIQDDIALIENRLSLTVGSKFEYNDYTGFEFQPNIRMIWNFKERQSIWTAVSRAVRTPSRAEQDVRFRIFNGPPTVYLEGNRHFESEEILAFELGYRIGALNQLAVNVALFYNEYDHLRTLEQTGLTILIDNNMEGTTYGLESSVDWRIMDRWRLQAAYTYLKMHLQVDNDSRDMTSENVDGYSPKHQISIRSSMDLGENMELDGWARYVDDLSSQNIGNYVTLDVRLAWKPFQNVELSVVGQNLLDSQHPEFEAEIVKTFPTEIERSVYGKITWRF